MSMRSSCSRFDAAAKARVTCRNLHGPLTACTRIPSLTSPLGFAMTCFFSCRLKSRQRGSQHLRVKGGSRDSILRGCCRGGPLTEEWAIGVSA
jgi:hypothetical protein